ncbi:MAG TPA: GuaB3 family IMP dehydrogenase-related protein [Enteractinococcus helveticum]|uniref:GuaB3 family IMP dehydrogenase-related protein n=1 Tax=Enteractinococcus helveticum TaxID=1837282 RepID=A0A921FMR5_9MICC|nr:GuaB3 family IMP dehydrogenase-related protein [Enteractinococcus helveticum]HJF14944.1 GuaB3 family IMP dehydrogenase-related protein [Enteractinococcus helveticum]
MTYQVEIGRGKRGRHARPLDAVSIVPTRRTRDPEDVSLDWQIDAFKFSMPVIGAPMDSVMSPATAIQLGKLGGMGVLNLEGLWTRYADPQPVLDEIATLEAQSFSPENTARLQQLYAAPIQPELISARLEEIREAGVVVAGALTPQRTQEFYKTVVDAGVDMFVIRGTTVSAQHVSETKEPLDLKKFIYELDVPVIVGGVAGYTPALHLMRTGAAGVLVGFGGGASSTTRRALGIRVPMATAISDIAEARRDYMDESGGRYVHVIADGGLGNSGDIVKAIGMGADAVMLGTTLARAEEAPGRGWHWGLEAAHPEFPRGNRTHVGTVAPMEQLLIGPSRHTNGTANLMGALRRAMASTGYTELKDFQKVEVHISETYAG